MSVADTDAGRASGSEPKHDSDLPFMEAPKQEVHAGSLGSQLCSTLLHYSTPADVIYPILGDYY